MFISERLKQFRESQNLSQGDIVENDHNTPGIETLEKCARALNLPMHQLFYDGEEIPKKDDRRRTASTGPRGYRPT
jgi:transcriptional regulator with XRE-family HTH domain